MKFDFEELQKFISQETGGRVPEGIEELQALTKRFMDKKNNAGIEDFEGYSAAEMQQMINFPWQYSGPVKILQADQSVLLKVPIYNLVNYLLYLINQQGGLKLTQTGNLPIKAVRELYDQRIISDYLLDFRKLKMIKETDSESITLARIIAEISKLTKKRNNVISLTSAGHKLLKDPGGLFHIILESYLNRFNWAYLDGYGFEGEFRRGALFSVILMEKFGLKQRPVEFYAEKYLKAFPYILTHANPRYENEDIQQSAKRCYSLRTFERFMKYFGLIDFEKGKGWQAVDHVKQSAIFNSLIQVSPPHSE